MNIVQQRLYNQRLSSPTFNTAEEVVRWLGAVQSQDYAGAKWAVGQRMKSATESTLDKAFNEGKILRTHLMRPTWHFVAPEDIRWLLMLTRPRVHAVNAFMYRQSGLEKSTFKKSNGTLEKALKDGKYLTRTELAATLEKAGISAEGFRLSYIMMYAELEGLICSGPRKGKQFTYALLEERVPQIQTLTREEALAELTRRYFLTRGPATLADFTWWCGLTMADAKNGIELVKAQLMSEVFNEQTYWFPDVKFPAKGKSLAAHLLPNYDEYFIGFKDRSAIGEVARKVNLPDDSPALIANVIVLNGQIVGGWKRTLNKDKVSVELTPIARLAKDESQAIERAGKKFGDFLSLSPEIIWH